jgi:hypothetical protein
MEDTTTLVEDDFKISVKVPTFPRAKNLTKEQVWGLWEEGKNVEVGMIVAKGYDLSNRDIANSMPYPQVCPVFLDKLPYKSVTVVCAPSKKDEVIYWLEYVLGGGCVQQICRYKNGIAIRANYMCW